VCLSDFAEVTRPLTFHGDRLVSRPAEKTIFWYKAPDQHIRARANAEKLDNEPPPLS
jgi:hypothetical protein